ncbi:hypothetical protein [Bythopirellula goksoeyrii]|uniref:Uncharacterized protein n=1 Tax=Bythopirellula goksoeyrii TaxID=1400387 RepID=A0A5B9QIG9_9BACT|nr:hypothetical protein [Bythopirellula goksoeyrii]QEG37390.1 hypothetical protein Pr1d_47330 [Bythopirellula goksoeyrii]
MKQFSILSAIALFIVPSAMAEKLYVRQDTSTDTIDNYFLDRMTG